MNNKLLVFIPTYNERENVEKIYKELKNLNLDMHLLFVDDNSPDGTGKVLDDIAHEDDKFTALHRQGKMGVGSAHINGIKYAYEHDFDLLITMDCDFTHRPTDIPKFLEYANDYDIVIGSRYMEQGSLEDWALHRKFLTKLGHFLTKYLLGVPYDASGAFRLYNLKKIDPTVFDKIKSKSYSFFFESLSLLCYNNAKVKEFPIKLPKRTYGHSKMAIKDIVGSLLKLIILWIRLTANKF